MGTFPTVKAKLQNCWQTKQESAKTVDSSFSQKTVGNPSITSGIIWLCIDTAMTKSSKSACLAPDCMQSFTKYVKHWCESIQQHSEEILCLNTQNPPVIQLSKMRLNLHTSSTFYSRKNSVIIGSWLQRLMPRH